jgi:hypothetical protein
LKTLPPPPPGGEFIFGHEISNSNIVVGRKCQQNLNAIVTPTFG